MKKYGWTEGKTTTTEYRNFFNSSSSVDFVLSVEEIPGHQGPTYVIELEERVDPDTYEMRYRMRESSETLKDDLVSDLMSHVMDNEGFDAEVFDW